ncbi:hypothetical protein [Maridesulfovibrio sp.]|uniref:hypothetical protein n=1 Tax=Maridesulfovibrio sp. TaxID=2795000 RepID=UPI003BABA47C
MAADPVEQMFRQGAEFHEMVINMKKLTPLKAIRAKCVDCCGDNRREVASCPVETCPLWIFRAGKRPKEGYEKSPLKTIRAYCLQCGELNSSNDVRLCAVKDCPLYPSRSGKSGRKLSKAERERRTARLKEARKARK